MEYLRELPSNTERQSDIANNATENNGSGGKENSNKRPLSGHKHKMDKVANLKRKRTAVDVAKEHEFKLNVPENDLLSVNSRTSSVFQDSV